MTVRKGRGASSRRFVAALLQRLLLNVLRDLPEDLSVRELREELE